MKVFFAVIRKNSHKLNPISAEGVVQLEELSSLLKGMIAILPELAGQRL